jgi:hypothetical protein
MERHFTSSQARLTLQLHNTEGDAAMNDAIANYFNANDCACLCEMTDTWSRIPYLLDRQSIIRDAGTPARSSHIAPIRPATRAAKGSIRQHESSVT